MHLDGQSKDIEVLGELDKLEDVTLRSITTPDLSYLARLRNLWSLDIKLGGNAEHLTRLEVAKLGLDPDSPDYDEHYAKVLPEVERRVEETRERAERGSVVSGSDQASVAPKRTPAD